MLLDNYEMEKVGDLDELEKLLGEIPDVTSANPYSERSDMDYCQKKLSRLALDGIINLDKTEPIYVNRNLHIRVSDERRALLSGPHQSTYSGTHLGESNLSQDYTQAHAFAGLGFINGTTMDSANAHLVNHTSLRDQPALLNGEHVDCYEKIPLNRKSWVTATQSPRLPHNISRDFCNFNVNIGSNSGAVPLGRRTPLFQPEVDFPVPSNHNYYLEASGLPYFHQPQVCQPCTPLIYLEKQHHGMPLQYLNMGQSENQNPIQGNWSTSRSPTNASTNQSYGDIYNSHTYQQQYVRELISDKAVNSRCIYPSNPVVPSAAYSEVQVLEEARTHFYPEKKFSRSQNFQSYKPERIDPLRGNNCLTSANRYENLLPNGQEAGSFSTRNVCFQYNYLNSRDSPCETDNNQKLPIWKENSVNIVNGKIYHMAKDQNGCRFLQKKFAEGTPKDIERIFTEIIMHIVELMTHPFGNYLVQKLLEVCNEDQKMQILHEITRNKGDLVRISCDMHGTRAVQQVIKSLRTPEQFSMVVSSLRHGIVNLIKNMNGNHVVQCCLKHLTPEYSEFLFEAITSNCVELATDRHGCCVLLKCLNYSDREQIHHLVKKIASNALLLSQDPFGNYAVQFIFDIHLPWARTEILDQLESNYGDLSVQKYSSNVVEKCLKHAGEERRSHIIHELISNPRLDQIVQDPYGNYVIQSALKLSKGAVHTALVEAVRARVSVLKTSPYGKKVLSCNSLKK
ncbi:Translational repressor MPT5/PUF4 and related RNA-binding proteins (Puf superfamily) [Handroanthus impetiginosus]|uniref:Translational repressor MPT5/PUF4 and related RNA-binding proteins (Puf superfamily) n=1 Tax=Handroanthus impetiginosus TaxID=429701 RepID=A0A2G9HM78_9LAMI|nr:Translational repressor MPT5/PUF4 and related RNA-binding proteins (Puf superfamily) [Handroanthus impetiginosus]